MSIREEYYGTGNVDSLVPTWNGAANLTETDISTGKTMLLSFQAMNSGAANAWVHFYNLAAASVVVGTTVPKKSFMIPSGGGMVDEPNLSIEFPTACSFAYTAVGGAAGTTTITNADEVVVNAEFYDKF